MSRRVLWLERPGEAGEVSDLASHQLPVRALERGTDIIKPFGLCRQRRGWNYDGTTADVADNLVTVGRNKFVLTGATRTYTGDDDGDLFLHNSAGAGTALFAGTVPYLWRCVYRDVAIACATDGQTPLRMYAGVAGSSYTSAPSTFNAGKATITATSSNYGTPEVGMFLYVRTNATPAISTCLKIIEVNSSTSLTAEGIKASATVAIDNEQASITGTTIPCIEVYKAGTVTTAGGSPGTLTGTGTKWSTGAWGSVRSDSSSLDGDQVLILTTAGWGLHTITAVGSDTSLTIDKINSHTDADYSIVRRCSAKDVANHKEVFWASGVAQHDDRVYYAPPGWNPSFPPSSILPIDTSEAQTNPLPDDFMLGYIDVPTPFDGDSSVAILSSSNPLVVLRKKSAWGIFGSPGGLDVALLPDGEGSGCIDIRSAWELSIGPVWASRRGVLAYINGRIVDLTAERINQEWRALVEDFDYGVNDYCTISEGRGCIVVHITTGAGTTQRTWNVYPYDQTGRLNPSWYRVSNFNPRFMCTSKLPDEFDKILAVSNAHQGRVIDYAPALSADGDARDDDGTSPVMEMWLPSSLPRAMGADVEERVLEVVVEAELQDSGGASSTLGGSVVSSQVQDSDSTVTTSLDSMASRTAAGPKKHKHKIGVKAGLHQVRLAKTATQTTETKAEIARVGVTVRRSGRPV